MSGRRRSAIDHARSEQRRDSKRQRERQIEDLIKRCSRAIERGTRKDCYYVARTLRDDLIPLVDEHTSRSFFEYDRELSQHQNWHWVALTSFLDSPSAYVKQLESGKRDPVQGLRLQTAGLSDPDTTARITVERTLESVTAIAEAEDIILPDYATRVEVRGLSVKLGDHLQDEELDLGDPIHGVSMQSGGMKTLHGGKPGTAKSAGLERDLEDFWLYDPDDKPDLDLLPDSRFKIIDLVDLEKGESWFYDVPQRQELLRSIREDHDLPPDFTERDEDRPRNIEILVPVTSALGEMELPYDTESQSWTVRPFVIPASDIPKSLLVSTMMSQLSSGQLQTIRQAWSDVDAERGDWSPADLAESIRSRDELSNKHKSDAIGVLRSLQDTGFIRTQQDDRTIDWEELFHDVDTITVFSQARSIVDDEMSQLFVIAYLLGKILRLRSGGGLDELPPAVLAFRELWRIVPHSRREVSDERAAAVQSEIVDSLSMALRQNRDFNIQVEADTQFPYDLDTSVRGMFNRYVVYTGTKKLIDGVFDWTGNNKSKSFRRTVTSKRGQGGVVGEVQPAIDRRWVEFLSPVEWVPPSHHHYSKLRDPVGWVARTEYLDHEELRPVPWDCSMPERLAVDPFEVESGSTDDDDEEIPPKELHQAEARNRRARGESYRQIAENIPNNPQTGQSYDPTTVREWTKHIEKGSELDDDD